MMSSTQTYTIWTKSLICHSRGCTVYNSNGEIVYRVDNYDGKKCKKVDLMDLNGNILFTLMATRFCRSESWTGNKGGSIMPWFHAGGAKSGSFFSTGIIRECKVSIENDGSNYRIEETSGKMGFRILDGRGGMVAEVKKKESWVGNGVSLGDDVLSLVVESHEDQSLIMALVLVYGLMRNII